jgi:hypothetical protein
MPPPVVLRPKRTRLLSLVGFFLFEVTVLELTPTVALKRPSAAVAVVELVVISLSLILDWYRLDGPNRWCVSPG